MKWRILISLIPAMLIVAFIVTGSSSGADKKRGPVPQTVADSNRETGKGGVKPETPADEPNLTPKHDGTQPAPQPGAETRTPEAAASVQRDANAVSGTAAGTSNYVIDWLSINNGGAIDISSDNYELGLSIGQSAAGEVSSGNYRMGLGFWYGAGGGNGCTCPLQADGDESGFIDQIDVFYVIDAVFFGAANPQDPGCPNFRFDIDCSNFVDALDFAAIVDYVFFGGAPPCDPCAAARIGQIHPQVQ